MIENFDDLFINPPEPSCIVCQYKRWSLQEQGYICINVNSPLYTEDLNPADWCDKWEKRENE